MTGRDYIKKMKFVFLFKVCLESFGVVCDIQF